MYEKIKNAKVTGKNLLIISLAYMVVIGLLFLVVSLIAA